MRYEVAIEKLYAMQTRGVRMGVQRMADALAYRRVDTRALPFIQVAGTNGKGSVSAMIAAGLQAAGHRVGLFTSPHLHRFTERIQIGGRPIGTREAAQRLTELLHAFAQPGAPEITFFELSTLLAVETFVARGCDAAVLEVGLGGRLDATNALPAVLTVITRIAFDHMQYLGATLSEIAREKAGIVKRGVPVVVGARQPEALAEIVTHAKRKRAKVWLIDRDFGATTASSTGTLPWEVWGPDFRLPELRLSLAGAHQRDNAACAVMALQALGRAGLALSPAAIRKGLSRVRWPARLESFGTAPAFLLDAAHNPDGSAALAAHLRGLGRPSRGARRVLVFGAMSDKDYPAMLHVLTPEVDAIVYTLPALPRAASLEALQAAQAGHAAPDVSGALALAKRLAGRSGLVIVAGSLFVVAQARAQLLGLRADPLIRM